jgi:hypothetical protein
MSGAGPHHYRSLSRAAGPGLLPLHGAETVSPGDGAHQGRGCWVIIKVRAWFWKFQLAS